MVFPIYAISIRHHFLARELSLTTSRYRSSSEAHLLSKGSNRRNRELQLERPLENSKSTTHYNFNFSSLSLARPTQCNAFSIPYSIYSHVYAEMHA